MEHSSLPEITYLNHSLHRLSGLRSDQRTNAESLIAYMCGSAFGTAVIDTPFSSTINFHPNIEKPQSATVNIGKIRLTVMCDVNRILVSAKKR